MTDNKYSIVIDDYKFTLLFKCVFNNRINVKIESELINPDNIDPDDNNSRGIYFWVYPSKSELGFWRFCSRQRYDNVILFKGIDYVQTTMVHLLLQQFINENITNLRELNRSLVILLNNNSIPYYKAEKTNVDVSSPFECSGMELYPDIYNKINHIDRRVSIQPFINMEETLPCGVWARDTVQKLKDFSDGLEKLYDVGTVELVNPNFYNNFQKIIQVNGEIYRVSLIKKRASDDNFSSIYLYFLKAKLTPIECILEKKMGDMSELFEDKIKNICRIRVHYMPFLLTPIDSKCNFAGLYSKYIASGAYICKLFDYSSEKHQQCTRQEVAFGMCNKTYSYIGSRYSNLFPFSQIETIDVEEDDKEKYWLPGHAGGANKRRKSKKRRISKKKHRRRSLK